jgi:hypothetical protein
LKPDQWPDPNEQGYITSTEKFNVDGYELDENLWGRSFYKFRPPL